MKFAVKIENIDKNCRKYVVARESDGILWYWGSWDDEEEAERAAKNVKGVVVERMD